MATGVYQVVLTIDGQTFTQSLRIDPDPSAPANLISAENEEDEDEEEMEEKEAKRAIPARIDD